MSPSIDQEVSFDRERPRLVRIAYRMLGSLAEAEDVVQDAWLRWSDVNQTEVRDIRAFLARTVTRLCLDYLKSARVRRETYVGSWLPEPLIELAGRSESPDEIEDVTLSLMMAFERLSPLERAAFLLHDVFDMPFDEVARVVERDTAACRQLAARARTHVRSQRPRYPLAGEQGARIARAFFTATASGDLNQLRILLAEDAVAYSDGGGQKPATLKPIYGRSKIVRLFGGLASKPADRSPRWLRASPIDGLPGFISIDRWGTLQTTALAVEKAEIVAIYTVRNPDKLQRVRELLTNGPIGQETSTRH
jgi:RNA polymerase sigma-70 factor (ECF subfamily)